MRIGLVTTVVVTALSLCCQVASAAAPGDAQRCRTTKLAAIATNVTAGLRCVAQRVKENAPDVDPVCLARADDKLARVFARADRLGACPPALAEARAAIASFVAAQAAIVLAGPTPTPLPTPVPTPAGSAGCGNGITDAGENCDGGPYCDASCNFAFPKACCDFGPVCVSIPDIPHADQCFLNGGVPRLGTVCGAGDPECVPGQFCAGPCVAETFPPTKFCCDGGAACGESTLANTEAVASLLLQCGLEGVVQGSCVAGHCIPGG